MMFRVVAFRSVLILLLAGAAGCADTLAGLGQPPPASPPPPQAPHSAKSPADHTPSGPSPRPRAKPPAAAAAAGPPASLPPQPPQPSPAVGLAPDRLIGAEGARVRRLLGPPSRIIDQPPAVLWRYESAACRLDLFFYMDLASRTFRVLTFDLVPEAPSGLTGAACVGSVRTRNR